MYSFRYHRAASIEEAKELHTTSDEGAYLAGGMTLIPTLKQRLADVDDVIDLGGIESLKGVMTSGTSMKVGGMAVHNEVAANATIDALRHLASGIGDPQVRNRGTIGGSIANNDPAADYPAAVLGLNATIHTNGRMIGADDFFTGMFDTALSDGEIVTAVEFPMPSRAAYVKFPNPASRYAVVGVMVSETNGNVRVAVTGAGTCVFRASAMEEALTSDFAAESISGISIDSSSFNSDIHASAEYRAHLVGVMAQRAVSIIS